MKEFRVLLINSNTMLDTLITAGIGVLAGCVKEAGFGIRLFDTTFYRTADITGDEARARALQVRPTRLEDFGVAPADVDVVEDFVRVVEEYKPDLIGLSCIEVTWELGARLLEAVAGRGIPTVAGGPFPTFAPEMCIRHPAVDMVCVGEGEEALVELCQRLRDGQDHSDVLNLWVKQNGKVYKNAVRPPVDLTSLPPQDWEVYDRRRFWKPMGGRVSVTGAFEMNRGCPYSCTYCINSGYNELYSDKYYREKNIDRLIDEMVEKKERYQLAYCYLVAESFLTTPLKRIERFVQLYREKVNLPFWVEVRPESVTREKIDLLVGIGCESVSVGVESGNYDLRKNVLGRLISDDTILRAFDVLRETKLRISANNVIGFPGETREMIFETIELDRKIAPDGVIVGYFSPYKGSKLREVCELEGLIREDEIAGDYRVGPTLDMPQMSKVELSGLHRTFPLYVKFPREEWGDIRRAEADTPEGNALFMEYTERYRREFLK
ncbi:radical SAM protein [Magnetospirillum sp. XM-1]|uniref:B12-binding domain-containing radical SAM protein n=1 Tax=Magnetospirillum sp. XM-1 TaxID=1663591 RepID=UPI000838F33D|nr:radical SAM protein [Magnetospirillum sp. XM-1]